MRKGIGGHHRAFEGASDIWLTPPEIVHKLGPFDLDPCAAPEPRPWDTAKEHWTEDGLNRQWHGRVWLNSPYGPRLKLWIAKLADHGRGTAISFARTETAAFTESIWPRASAILFLANRLHFHRPDGKRAKYNGGAPSVLISFGDEDAEMLKTSGIKGAFVRLR